MPLTRRLANSFNGLLPQFFQSGLLEKNQPAKAIIPNPTSGGFTDKDMKAKNQESKNRNKKV